MGTSRGCSTVENFAKLNILERSSVLQVCVVVQEIFTLSVSEMFQHNLNLLEFFISNMTVNSVLPDSEGTRLFLNVDLPQI